MTIDGPASPDPLTDLLDTLDLEELGTARITVEGSPARRASTSAESGRHGLPRAAARRCRTGGSSAARCSPSASWPPGVTIRDVDDGDGPRRIHSLHGYFMRPGDDTQPIRFAVERMRDGSSFSTRRVHAIQNGRADHVDDLLLPGARRRPGPPGPDARRARPRGLPSLAELFGGVDHPGARAHLPAAPDRAAATSRATCSSTPAPEQVAPTTSGCAPIGGLPDDPLVHAAVLAYASDYSLLEPVLRRHGWCGRDPRLRVASLDHAMWFHRPARADEWLLYAQQSPSASGGRGLGLRPDVRAGRRARRDGRPGGHGPRRTRSPVSRP